MLYIYSFKLFSSAPCYGSLAHIFLLIRQKSLVPHLQFQNRYDFLRHMREEHQFFKCAFCEETFPNDELRYNDHVEGVHYAAKDLTKCNICDLVHSQAFHDKHMERHKQFFKDQKSIPTVESLEMNGLIPFFGRESTDGTVTPAPCKICKGVFLSKFLLMIHQQQAHDSEQQSGSKISTINSFSTTNMAGDGTNMAGDGTDNEQTVEQTVEKQEQPVDRLWSNGWTAINSSYCKLCRCNFGSQKDLAAHRDHVKVNCKLCDVTL